MANMLVLLAVPHFAGEGTDITLLAPVSGRNGRVERVDLELERFLDRGEI
jgi:hypothetical protein